MKKFLLVATVLIGALTVKAQDKKPDDVIKVNTEVYDFGKIPQSKPVYHEFVIVNEGKIIGEGYHTSFGNPHAEVEAIRSVNDKNLLSTFYILSRNRTTVCLWSSQKSDIQPTEISYF